MISVLKTFGQDDYEESTIKLKEGINLSDLTLTDDKGGVEFEVDTEYPCK